MTTKALRSLIQDVKYPIALMTRNGDRVVLPDRRHLYFPPTYPDLVVACPLRRGLMMIDAETIDAVEAGVAEVGADVDSMLDHFTRRAEAEQGGDSPQP